MSRIKEMFSEMGLDHAMSQESESKKTVVSARLNEGDLWRLDFIAKRTGYTRSALAQVLLEEGILEAAEGLGFDLTELQALHIAEKCGKPIEECREMLSKTGISIPDQKETK